MSIIYVFIIEEHVCILMYMPIQFYPAVIEIRSVETVERGICPIRVHNDETVHIIR